MKRPRSGIIIVRCFMKILVCYKYIRDENEISVAPDRTIKADAAAWVISPYDLNAIEAGMKLAAASGGAVEVLTAGGEAVDNSKMRKAVLSRGPAKMYGVRCPECGDLLSTARLLKQAIEKIGGVDLVICGEGSGDMYSQQLGNLLGALMGLPTLNCVSSLEYDAGVLTAGRVSGSRTEKYHISCPAVVSVTSDICRAHIPSMKEILAAGKKPVEVWDASEFEASDRSVECVSILAPESAERRKVVFRQSDDGGVDEFVKAIRKHL